MRRIRSAPPAAYQPPVVVARHPPLADPAESMRHGLQSTSIVTKTKIIGANRVVQIPHQAGSLMLDIARILLTFVTQFPAVRDTVLIVIKIGPDR